MSMDTMELVKECGYDSLEDWALDQNYVYNKHTDTWYDETRTPISLEEAFAKAVIEDMNRYVDAQY